MKNKKFKSKINLFCNIAIVILFIISLIIVIFPPHKLSSDNFEISYPGVLGKITNDDIIKQNIKLKKNYSGIGFLVATYDTILDNGSVLINICDQSNKCIKKIVMASTISDNSYFYINSKLKKNVNYTIIITCNNIKKPITFYTTEAKIENASLKVDNEKRKNNIVMAFTYKKNNYFPIWYCLFLISLIFCIKFFIVGGKTNEK